MNKFCKIVQDLLPNYVEKLTYDETNEFIEEHLKTCEECSNYLKNMQSSDIDTIDNDVKINYMGKFNKKIRTLKVYKIFMIIIAIVIAIFIGITTYRYMILTDIYKKSLIDIDNIYYFLDDRNSIHIKYYEKDGIAKQIITDAHNKELPSTVMWQNSNTGEKLSYSTDTDYYTKIDYNFMDIPRIDLNIETIFDRLKIAMNLSIKIGSKIYDYKECYYVKGLYSEQIVDKETGLLLHNYDRVFRENTIYTKDGERKTVTSLIDKSYKYSLNTVTDEDVKRTDLPEKDDSEEVK